MRRSAGHEGNSLWRPSFGIGAKEVPPRSAGANPSARTCDATGSAELPESPSGSAISWGSLVLPAGTRYSVQVAHFHGFRRFPAPAIFLLDDNVDLQPLRAQRREQLSPAHLDREHRVGIETR